jgi:hypothetical protein
VAMALYSQTAKCLNLAHCSHCRMTIDQMYTQLKGIYRSIGIPSAAADERVCQVRSLLNLMPEARAKQEMEGILRTLAVSRSPSAANLPGKAGNGVEVSDALRIAAWELQSLAVNLLKKTDGPVHAETAVSMAAGFAGALLVIQYHGDQLHHLKPGSVILSEVVNEKSTDLLEFFFGCEQEARLPTDALKEVPAVHRPQLSPEEISTKFVPHAAAACWRHELSASQAPFAAAMATVFLVEQLTAVLPTTIANAIAVHSLIFCSKTVPTVGL